MASGGGFRRFMNDENVVQVKSSRKFRSLLHQLEAEFEKLVTDNQQLRERVAVLEKAQPSDDHFDGSRLSTAYDANSARTNEMSADHGDLVSGSDKNVLRTFTKNKAIKTRHKLKAHTSKIVSSFKPPSLACNLVKEFKGHRDGVWDVSVSRTGYALIGTASADKTARIWGVDSGRCLAAYSGHNGSVNSIAFHPSQELAMTASGDGTAHIWKVNPPCVVEKLSNLLGVPVASSEESADSEADDEKVSGNSSVQTIRTPVTTLTGHQGVVSGCQWMSGEFAVTSSWDRTANLYNVETSALLQSLAGHDGELTHVACHPSQRLVVTSSLDSTFRLWDFREAIHSVSVFQGHTDSVMCACFSGPEHIVSGSDDRTVKVWDLRNMRAAITTINTSSSVNRLSVSHSGLVAIPQDNRHVVIHELASGQKLSRLPRDSTHTHHRMVTSTAWAPEEWRTRATLFSAGFDRLAFAWSVKAAAKMLTNKDAAGESSKPF